MNPRDRFSRIQNIGSVEGVADVLAEALEQFVVVTRSQITAGIGGKFPQRRQRGGKEIKVLPEDFEDVASCERLCR